MNSKAKNVELGLITLFGMASLLSAGESVPNLSEDQKLEMSISGGQFGREISSRGRRLIGDWENSIGRYHWDTHLQEWNSIGLTFPVPGSSDVDDNYSIHGTTWGAQVREFEDATGQWEFLADIVDVIPTEVAISFPHAALVFPGETVRMFRFNSVQGSWYFVGSFKGSSVDIHHDTMIVGSPEVGTSQPGIAVFYRFIFGEWKITQYYMGMNSGDEFGASLALNGSWLVLGAPAHDSASATDIGAVHVYRWTGSQFTYTRTLLGKRDFDRFGTSLALLDGNLAVGSPFEDIVANQVFFPNVGAVYVFWLDGDLWDATARLWASDWAVFDNLGLSVAISDYGVLAGAPFAEGPGDEPDAGAIYFWAKTTVIFSDGFETGNLSKWSSASF